MAIKNLRPPHYSADKPGSYVYRNDDALDRERYERELSEMGAAAEARLKADPGADISDLFPGKHPLEMWWTGVGRYDLDAVGYFMGAPVRIGDYFSKGKPTIFQLRRLSPEQHLACTAMRRRGDFELASLKACRYGLADVIDGGIKLVRNGDGEVSDLTINQLMSADPLLPVWIGTAILLGYCGPITADEGRPSTTRP